MSFTAPATKGPDISFDVTVQGSTGLSSHDVVAVHVNNKPVVMPPKDSNIVAGIGFNEAVIGTDADGDPVTLTLLSGPAGAKLSGGMLSWPDPASWQLRRRHRSERRRGRERPGDVQNRGRDRASTGHRKCGRSCRRRWGLHVAGHWLAAPLCGGVLVARRAVLGRPAACKGAYRRRRCEVARFRCGDQIHPCHPSTANLPSDGTVALGSLMARSASLRSLKETSFAFHLTL